MATITFRPKERDEQILKELKKRYLLDSDIDCIRYCLRVVFSGFVSEQTEQTEQPQQPEIPEGYSFPDPNRDIIKQKAKENMASFIGKINSNVNTEIKEIIKTPYISASESFAVLNDEPINEEALKQERMILFKKQNPAATEGQLEKMYLTSIGVDTNYIDEV